MDPSKFVSDVKNELERSKRGRKVLKQVAARVLIDSGYVKNTDQIVNAMKQPTNREKAIKTTKFCEDATGLCMDDMVAYFSARLTEDLGIDFWLSHPEAFLRLANSLANSFLHGAMYYMYRQEDAYARLWSSDPESN